MSSMGVATRRRFVGMVFYPNGAEVADQLEIGPGMSADVAEIEDAATKAEHERVWNNDPFVDDIIQLAEWYTEGVDVVGSALTPAEHLVTFFLSAYSTITAGIAPVARS